MQTNAALLIQTKCWLTKRTLLPAFLATALLATALLAVASAAAYAATPAATGSVTVGAGTGVSLGSSFVDFSFEANVLAGTAPSAGTCTST